MKLQNMTSQMIVNLHGHVILFSMSISVTVVTK
ncbi:hypothetical protein RDI58_017496 [Solanum bulbocastanum]|uniref:Uncharacterized protein n=1 Tax=Solanum bulbocastanum TaxID=147425 RepID=A0AAN8TFK5_SOLBU